MHCKTFDSIFFASLTLTHSPTHPLGNWEMKEIAKNILFCYLIWLWLSINRAGKNCIYRRTMSRALNFVPQSIQKIRGDKPFDHPKNHKRCAMGQKQRQRKREIERKKGRGSDGTNIKAHSKKPEIDEQPDGESFVISCFL